jgi:hypothetical protein
MLKAMAVLRTLSLLFITGYSFRAMPWYTSVPRTLDEQYARCSGAVDMLVRAAWFAVAWILLETIVGWWMAARQSRKNASAAAPPKPAGA